MQRLLSTCVVALALVTTAADAGSMRHQLTNQISDPYNNNYWAIAQQPRFDSVGFLFGRNAPSAQFPNGSRSLCGGTFISATTVITAAHCVYDSNGLLRAPAEMQFGLGPTTSNPTAMFNVYDIEVRPDYVLNSIRFELVGGLLMSSVVAENDIALLQVGNPLVTDVPTSPVYTGVAPIGANAIITGYGTQGLGSVAYDPATAPQGDKLAGLNVVDRASVDGTKLLFDFDSASGLLREGLPSNYREYIPLPGDSGAGVFINDPIFTGANALMALNSTIAGDGTYGTTAQMMFLAPYWDWIREESFGAVDFAQKPGYSPSNPYTPTVSPDEFTKTFLGIPILPFVGAYFDPDLAEAYEFVAHEGPLFSGFQVPFTDDDGLYEVYSYDEVLGTYVFAASLAAGDWFDLAASGVSRFAVGGVGAYADTPVFGLKFASAGYASFSQREIKLGAAPAVPEPQTWALLLLGFGTAGVALRRRDRRFTPARPA